MRTPGANLFDLLRSWPLLWLVLVLEVLLIAASVSFVNKILQGNTRIRDGSSTGHLIKWRGATTTTMMVDIKTYSWAELDSDLMKICPL